MRKEDKLELVKDLTKKFKDNNMHQDCQLLKLTLSEKNALKKK